VSPNHATSKPHHKKKSDKTKSKSIDESHLTSNSSEDASDPTELSINQPFGAVTCERLDSFDCDLSNETNEKNQKNLNNLSTMSEQAKVMTIESAGGIADKVDKDEKELIKASQEINRSNRKLIKQTFNSNVLEIETANAEAAGSDEKAEDKAVTKDEDDWDTL
jgi:hypothetical protein